MNQVELHADGTLTTEGTLVSKNPLGFLGHRILLTDACVLRTFFNLIARYNVLSQLNTALDVLQDQFGQCPAQGCQWDGFEKLQFSKIIAMTGFPGKPSVDIYHHLSGVGSQGSVEIRELPLEVLLDMPLILGPLDHKVFGDNLEQMAFDTAYTLFEFIDGMAWALSFQGASIRCLTDTFTGDNKGADHV